jgi:hypothetical protein
LSEFPRLSRITGRTIVDDDQLPIVQRLHQTERTAAPTVGALLHIDMMMETRGTRFAVLI